MAPATYPNNISTIRLSGIIKLLVKFKTRNKNQINVMICKSWIPVLFSKNLFIGLINSSKKM